MNIINPSRPARLWPNKKSQYSSSGVRLTLIALLISFLLFFYYSCSPGFIFPIASNTSTSHSPRCTSQSLTLGEKFLWYAPHSGFSNQLSEFKNAILMAGILNRTLIVPPVLDHHAVALGSCPKFRVLGPNEIRISVWNHVVELIQGGRYVSIAEIMDISSLVSSSLVRVIDLRDFVSLWCGVNIDFACFIQPKTQSPFIDSLKQCGSLLSGFNGNVGNCLYAVEEDCRTTVWTYQNGDKDGIWDSFQPDKQLKKKKKISYVRRHRDVYKTLGPDSEAESASLLAFGSLFTSPYKGSELYIDIHEAPGDQRLQSLIEMIKLIPFAMEITSAAKKYSHATIKDPFLCAQLRLLDGQFKNHWKTTFLGLKQKLASLKQKWTLPIHIFLMTDLPEGNWTSTYLGDLASNSHHYKLHFLREKDELVREVAKKLMAKGRGLRSEFVPSTHDNIGEKQCPFQRSPDVLLYLEETICSCASLGFVGTAGSTIAESIELMRNSGFCLGQSLTAL
ncbi:O-fucosyltransferase family protein [Quillaja saponaria]|uniref:O-fucosyltransferase family protein n=1 Tax=Quillaja saponaria TaxID=32244 RepID=A0AAD7KRX6_QUISA|nr:O-fucosyltransferase family protein [Quillaja saponaria]